jgi:peroxiredoxin
VAELIAVLQDLGFEDVAVTRHFDTFNGTSKAHIARKFGVVGVNLFARAPQRVQRASKLPRDSWIERIRRAAARLGGKKNDATLGAVAPDFELPLSEGKGSFQLAAQRGHPLLLMFLPPDWCPVCQACMRVYKDNATLLRSQGVQLVVVTTEVTPEVRAFVRGIDLEHVITLDADYAVARRFGATHRSERTRAHSMLPISFFIDSGGIVKRRSELDAMELCVTDFSELFQSS